MADKKPFLLRIDPALWTDLESWAAAELRSVNGQDGGVGPGQRQPSSNGKWPRAYEAGTDQKSE